jgi:hypothetical protein
MAVTFASGAAAVVATLRFTTVPAQSWIGRLPHCSCYARLKPPCAPQSCACCWLRRPASPRRATCSSRASNSPQQSDGLAWHCKACCCCLPCWQVQRPSSACPAAAAAGLAAARTGSSRVGPRRVVLCSASCPPLAAAQQRSSSGWSSLQLGRLPCAPRAGPAAHWSWTSAPPCRGPARLLPPPLVASPALAGLPPPPPTSPAAAPGWSASRCVAGAA